MIIALSTALTLLLAPVPAQSCAPALDAEERARAESLASTLRDAEAAATEDPEAGLPGLESALAAAAAESDLVARDGNLGDARLYAQLALARSLLATERKPEAIAVIDRALSTAGGRELPAKLFGPSLVSLHDERRAALGKRARGTLEVRCKDDCFVAVEATAAACGQADTPATVELTSGTYRVVVIDRDEPARRSQHDVEIVAGVVQTVELDNPPPDAGRARRRGGAVTPTVDDDTRKLPRWAGILGMAVGAAAIVAGGVLVGVHHRCPDLSDSQSATPCKRRLNTKTTGYAVIGAGAAFMIGFTIPFAIGESRQAKARKRNTATWRPIPSTSPTRL